VPGIGDPGVENGSRDQKLGPSIPATTLLDSGGQLAYQCSRVTLWKRQKFILLFLAC
jgi:hypothetical protein